MLPSSGNCADVVIEESTSSDSKIIGNKKWYIFTDVNMHHLTIKAITTYLWF